MPNIKETISQVLSPTNATYVNGVSVRRNFAKAVLDAIYQGLVERDGRGVNGKFVTEQLANDSGQVFVNRLKAHSLEGREHGAAKNGGAFSNTGYMSATETVGIEILQYFDEPIIIPRAIQDRIDLDLASGEIANYVKSVTVALNGSSWAAKWFASYNTTADKRNVVKITASDYSNKLALLRFQEANSLLDEGDLDHDVDVFDTDTRIATFQMKYRPTLLSGGILVLGGANYGYDIARKGTVDAESDKRTLDDGFWGVIDGVPVHGISNLSLKYAAWFCGMPDFEFAKGDHLHGFISSSYANARGFSTVEQIKTIDAHGGQGLEIQAMSKIGAVCWYPKGNVLITGKDYDPIADLKTIFTGLTINFKLKAKGSRYYCDEKSITSVGASAFTLNAVAKDDAGVSHIAGAAFFVGEAPVETVADFIDEYNDATYKGSANIGSATSTTIASSEYVNCLVIADDGTCTLVSAKRA